MPFALLLSMQAAGLITDWFATNQQSDLIKMAGQLQQAGIEANIQQTRLQAEDASLQAMRSLRKNLGSQIAVMAARGTSTAAGSAVLSQAESVRNFNSDERMRRMNLLARETELKGQGLISSLETSGQETKLWSSFASRSLNTLSSSPDAWKKLGEGFGLTKIGG